MPRLPSFVDLGPAQAPGPRPTGSYDVSGYARGAEALAAGGRALGRGVETAAKDVADVYEKRTEAAYLDGTAGVRTALSNLHTELADSKDYANLPQRYSEGAQAIVDKWADTIPDGRMREHFMAATGEVVARGAGSIHGIARAGAAQADGDARTTRLLGIKDKINSNPDDPTIKDDVVGLDAHVQGAVSKGYITPEHAALEMRQAGLALDTTEAGVEATRRPLKFLHETGGLPRGDEALPNYWNKDVAARAVGVNPNLMAVIKRASEISGVQFIIGDKGGTRDQATQDQLVAGGFSQTRNSNHLTGNAIDLIPIVNGKPNADAAPQHFAEVSRAMKQASTELGVNVGWGGDWKSFKDDAHFELPRGTPNEAPLKYGHLDPLTLSRLQTHAQTVLRQQATDVVRIASQQQTDAANRWGLALEDASAGRGAMPSLEAIRTDPLIAGTPHELTLTQRWDAANKADDSYKEAFAAFSDPNGRPFNPFNENDVKNVDKVYQNLSGGDPNKALPTLQTVIARSGIVPPSAAEGLRGALSSNNADSVAWAAQIARNMVGMKPTIFAGVKGQKELEAAAGDWERYAEHQGLTADQAARRIIDENSPKAQSEVAAHIKGQDIHSIIKDNLKLSDLEAEFNQSMQGGIAKAVTGQAWSWGGPDVADRVRDATFQDYSDIFRDKYKATGNVQKAKDQALAQMRVLWGVTRFRGTRNGELVRFPPERAPAYADIPDVADRIADQAIERIYHAPGGAWEDANGKRGVTRDTLVLLPVLNGETAQAYFSGRPVPYMLSWEDAHGVYQMEPVPFVFDAHAEREKISEGRRASLEKGQAASIKAEDRQMSANEAIGAFGQPVPVGAPEDKRLQLGGPLLDAGAHAGWRDGRPTLPAAP